MKYFISSRWRNRDRVLELYEKLGDKVGKKNIFCFFHHDDNIHSVHEEPELAMKEYEAIEEWRNDIRVKKIFDRDLSELNKCDVLVMLLPAGKSAHIEAGIAYGLGKKCVLIGDQKETGSHYLIFDDVFSTTDDFINSLS